MKYSGLNISKDVLNVDIFAKQQYNEQLHQFIYCYLFIAATWPVAEQLLLNKCLLEFITDLEVHEWIEVLNNVQLYVQFDWFTRLHLKTTDAWSVVLFFTCMLFFHWRRYCQLESPILCVVMNWVYQRIRIASHENVWLPEQRPVVG